jgi:hypothetical protein
VRFDPGKGPEGFPHVYRGTIRDKLMIALRHGLIATQRAGIALINRKALEKKSNGTYVPPEG